MSKIIYSVLFILICGCQLSAQVSIKKLLVENRQNPVGLDQKQPKFTWILSSNERNKSQSAYQIQVATDISNLQSKQNLVWDSKKVLSDQSTFVKYEGIPLLSGEKYYWRVTVWDEKGNRSVWSPVAYWQMGFLDPTKEFKAKWITAGFEESPQRESPLFKKDFSISKKNIKRATAYISSHGMYEASLNGQRIGDAYLTPGWTSYNKRLQYQVYEVTKLIQSGQNTVHAMLGNGWYRGVLAWANHRNIYGKDLALLFQLEILYEDGSIEIISSDDSWQSSKSKVLFSEIYDGESIDTRINDQQINWAKAKIENFPKDHLIATYNEPIRKQENITPIFILESPKEELIVDFGQNLVGWVQLKVSGKAGDTIRIFHAEELDKDGNFYTENLRAAKQQMTYILDGSQHQILEPHFSFQGFRYVKIEGLKDTLIKDQISAIALYSDIEETGIFRSSDPLLNQLQRNIQWSQKGNFLDVPTDCPQRDERMGWTGDAQAFFKTAAYNMHVHNFFSKWLKDLAADQKEDGRVPFVVPHVMGTNAYASAGWADAAVIIPWQSYLLYGDPQILKDQYSSMKAWVDYMVKESKDGLWNTGFHFGDWLFYTVNDDRHGKSAITDKYFIAQCFFAYSSHLLAKTANLLGHQDDAETYAKVSEFAKKAFLKEYVSPSGRLGPNTQTAYVLALQFDLLPEHLRAQAAQRLVDNIKNYDYHLTTGFLGTPYICHVLSRFGHEDIAYELLLQTSYPSWLYPITKGATTIWERWDGIKPNGSFQNPKINSFNHYAYGAIGDWMYKNIAGINNLESHPGYKKIKIKPVVGGGLQSARGQLETYYGTISSQWEFYKNELIVTLNIPVNTTAEVYLPCQSIEQVKEKGKTITAQVLDKGEGYIKVLLGSGNYRYFIAQSPPQNDLIDYVGNYRSIRSFGPKMEIKLGKGNLYLIYNGQQESMKEIEVDTFVSISTNKKISFSRSRTGRVISMKIELYPGLINAKKE